MFRMANWRRNRIVEAQLRVVILVTERTREGEVLRQAGRRAAGARSNGGVLPDLDGDAQDRRRQPVPRAGRAREAGREERRPVPEPDGLRRDDRPDRSSPGTSTRCRTSPSARASSTCWAPTIAGGSRSTSGSSTTSSGSTTRPVSSRLGRRRGEAGRAAGAGERDHGAPRRVTRSSTASGPSVAWTSNVRSTARALTPPRYGPRPSISTCGLRFASRSDSVTLVASARAASAVATSAISIASAPLPKSIAADSVLIVAASARPGCAASVLRVSAGTIAAPQNRVRAGGALDQAHQLEVGGGAVGGAGACRRDRPCACPTLPAPSANVWSSRKKPTTVGSFFDDQSVRRPCFVATRSSPFFCSSSRA